MKTTLLVFRALMAFAVPGLLLADIGPYSPTPADLNDLSHDRVWTWRTGGVNLTNQIITAASLTIQNISNWNNDPNRLHIYLLDTAKLSGTQSTSDPVNPGINDYFANTANTALVAPSTQRLLLDAPSFNTTVVPLYTLTFDAAEIGALTNYIDNGGDFALGFDPDCHFYNAGITFRASTSPVPEPSSILLLGTFVALSWTAVRRKLAPTE